MIGKLSGNGPFRWGAVGLLLAAIAASGAVSARAATSAWSGAWSQISAGFSHTCALDTAGKAYCWGAGQLGDGSSTGSTVPVAVDVTGVLAGKRLVQISAGVYTTCALDSAGLAYCWGSGILGNNTRTGSPVPVAVSTAHNLAGKVLVQIAVGADYACALDSTGKAYCWGYGGSLGTVSQKNAYVPVVVDRTGVLAGKVLVRISMQSGGTSNGGPTCVVSNRGKGFCWGLTSLPASIDPSGVLDSVPLSQVAMGSGLEGRHTCVVSVAGRAYCWGDNSHGALGDGTTLDRASPTAVATSGALNGRTFTRVATGAYHSCLLDTDGLAYCFGSGYSGQLGDGTFNVLSAAVPVNRSGALNGKVLTAITTGLANTCALDTAGAAYCWGNNFEGELGIGTKVSSDLPAQVVVASS